MEAILLFSDVHADMGALDEILRLSQSEGFTARYGRVSRVINLGDVMERGHDPGAVIDRLEGLRNVESILGNHDEAFLRRIPVSGSDKESERAHEAYRQTGQYEKFFRGMGKYYVDTKNKLYAVHGGPIDPCAIPPPAAAGAEAWLYTQPWQRISDIGIRYADGSGYHYLPADAFDAVRPTFGGEGFVIVCGHEHREAAYRRKGGAVEDALPGLEERSFELAGRKIAEKKIALDESSSFLVRLGIAGPGGYGDLGPRRSYFGVLSIEDAARTMYLLNFIPSGGTRDG